MHKKHFNRYKLCYKVLSGICAVSLFFSQGMCAHAGVKEDNMAAHQAMAVQSNEVKNWPTGPIVSAEAAILMEADTGAILYAKNIHKQEYPASITKILTTLIASERCSTDELVSFSKDAVFDIDRGSNHIAIDVGEKLTMEECLNAILIRSANEVALAVAEHICGGPWEDFAAIMNERAKELGCLNSNFVNPNGLPNEEHVTTAYDMAMIGKAFFANESLCKITLTPMLKISASEYQPDNITEVNKMELIPRGDYAYEYVIGCKTGYTNAARNTLVSCAEKNGMKLICVVLNDEGPYQYEDTIALYEYGFNNFDKINVSQTETKYNIDDTGSFYSDNDIFGNSQSMLSLNEEACIILPKTVSFESTDSTISYDTANDRQAALITYTYEDVVLGTVPVDFAASQGETYTFDTVTGEQQTEKENTAKNEENKEAKDSGEPVFIFVNIFKILAVLGVIAVIAIVVLVAKLFLKNYQFSPRTGSSRSHRPAGRRRRRSFPLFRKDTDTLSMGSSFRIQRKEQIREAKRRQRYRRYRKKQGL